jgi:hypothetical protein
LRLDEKAVWNCTPTEEERSPVSHDASHNLLDLMRAMEVAKKERLALAHQLQLRRSHQTQKENCDRPTEGAQVPINRGRFQTRAMDDESFQHATYKKGIKSRRHFDLGISIKKY